ncbi:hypothetical protein Cgig2_028313 [Carnegiea gigantea]|uniref:Uncharacterized protein n=1 Tax=Carnegiea gigantea TaxID=171969 RepID=A0A9Q1GM44_9CARY|nr:hypothetical protein Cgig2_028313 [Carnegiea gigantea]
MPQVVFLVMLLNDDVKLGVLHGWLIDMIELALKELRSRILQAHRLEIDNDQEKEENSGSGDASPLPSDDGEEYSQVIRPSAHRRLGASVRPMGLVRGPAALCREPEWPKGDYECPGAVWQGLSGALDYRDLCPSFTLSNAEEAAYDVDILKIVQATSYAIVVNDAVELFVMGKALESALKGLRWINFCILAEDQQACPSWGVPLQTGQSWNRTRASKG